MHARRWLVQDTLKVVAYWLLYRFDVFQFRSQAEGTAKHPADENLLGVQARMPGQK
jgi:hypothetical protein